MSKTKEPYIISDLQRVTRDFSFIVDKDREWQDVKNKLPFKELTLRLNRNRTKVEYSLTDIYEAEGKKTFTIKAVFQPFDKVMTGEEIETVCEMIREAVEPKKRNNMTNKQMKVKREDQNQELLEALEKDGFTLKFGDAGKYADCSKNKDVYRTYCSGLRKEEYDIPTEPWLYVAKEVLIKATIRALQPFKSEPLIIRSAYLKEEEVQVREEMNVVFDRDTQSYSIEYQDFKCIINAECIADNQVFQYLEKRAEEAGLSNKMKNIIGGKLACRMDGVSNPLMEIKYYSYIRFYSKLFK